MDRLRELVDKLNEASRAYYSEDREIMSNFEYDALYDELVALEKETGIVLADSPTVNVGYEVREDLPKVTFDTPMLSLDKTKDVEALAAFAGDHKTLLSWKMDGLTIVLTYENGELTQAVTRGNGTVGELVTPNAKTFKNLPVRIPYKGTLVLRGEAVIRYSDFEKINAEIGDAEAKYKNPRNLCSGSVRQLNSEITAQRRVYFYAFALVSATDVDFDNSRQRQFEWLREQGFSVVEYEVVTGETVAEAVKRFSEKIATNDFPSDGLVALYDDIAYGDSLGTTAKFPRNAYAFKWQDELRETVLRDIEWSPSRTGLINPVAIFDPVELEGTTVRRASLHNVSILEGLRLGIGDTVTVYKANMIIPQIAENLTKSGTYKIPDRCPVCGGEAVVMTDGSFDAEEAASLEAPADALTDGASSDAVKTLHCINPECQAKKIRAYDLFVCRDALNIEGLSEQTLEKLIGAGFIHTYADIFRLEAHKDAIAEMEGFGTTSVKNLLASIKKASETTLTRVLYGIGIPGIGLANAKLLTAAFDDDLDALKAATADELSSIKSIGPVLAASIEKYFNDENNQTMLSDLLGELTLKKESRVRAEGGAIAGKTFVITGSLMHYSNRRELQNVIESLGGRVTGSVSASTDYLINNDSKSASSKNKTAQKLGIPVITEDAFREMIDNAD